jgi:type IV pilus assembly protein PilN
MAIRVKVNLASEPFRRDRPMLAASAVVGLLLVALLAMLVAIAFAQRGQETETRVAIDGLRRQMQTLGAEQAKFEQILRRPENAEVLDKVLFINTLLYRKGISWTKIFADLEEVVPHNVRVISVRPQVNAQNDVLLDMVVGAQSQAPVIDMLKRLESSPQFGQTAVHNWLPPAQTEPLFRYRISVSYGQKL